MLIGGIPIIDIKQLE
jgi:hypothetical protein